MTELGCMHDLHLVRFNPKKEFKMAYVITDACDNCGTCKETCPSEAIHEGEPHHTINVEECIECGACLPE